MAHPRPGPNQAEALSGRPVTTARTLQPARANRVLGGEPLREAAALAVDLDGVGHGLIIGEHLYVCNG